MTTTAQRPRKTIVKELLADSQAARFRPDWFVRFFIPACDAALFWGFAIDQFTLGTLSDALIGVGLASIGVLIIRLVTFRLIVVAGVDWILIRNLFWTYLVPIADVESLEHSYQGLVIRTRSGRQRRATAIAKWNVARWLKLQTRADRAASCILARRDQAVERRRH